MGLSCILFIHPCPSWPPWQCSSEDTWMKTASTCGGGFQRHHSGFPKDLVHCVLTPQKNTENEPLELQKSTKNWKKTKTSSSEGLTLTFHFLASSTCRFFLQAVTACNVMLGGDNLNSASCWDTPGGWQTFSEWGSTLFFFKTEIERPGKNPQIFRPGAYCLRSFFFQMISLISDQFTLVACFSKGMKD